MIICFFKFLVNIEYEQLISINPVHKLKHDIPFISYKHASFRISGKFNISFLCYIIIIKKNALYILDENSNTKQFTKAYIYLLKITLYIIINFLDLYIIMKSVVSIISSDIISFFKCQNIIN